MRYQLIERRLKNIIKECIDALIIENRVVTFGGTTYPDNGWCVILSGGPGSGKGYVSAKQLPIDGKIINVDKFKEMYVKMSNGVINGEDYDSRNPEHVSFVHYAVKDKKWKEKYKDNIFNSDAHNSELLPNIIFDMTGDKPEESVVSIVKDAKDLGYNTMLVWVVSSRSESIIRNLQRPRRVSDEVLHTIHNNLLRQMPPFLDSPASVKYLDDAWIIFGSTDDVTRPNFSDEEAKDVAIHLKKTSSGFKMEDNVKERLDTILGVPETNPENPEVYVPSDDVLRDFGERYRQNVTKPNFSDFTSPRTREKTGIRIRRNGLPKNFIRRK